MLRLGLTPISAAAAGIQLALAAGNKSGAIDILRPTKQAIEMAPDYVRRKLTPWWQSTTMKVLGVVVLGAVAWAQYQKHQTLAK